MFSSLLVTFNLTLDFVNLLEEAVHSSLAKQLVTSLLPEVTLTLIISYVLTALALELGEGRSKKLLALETLDTLRHSLALVGVLYALQFSVGGTHNLLNGYFITNDYVVALKLLTLISTLFIFNNSAIYLEEHLQNLLEYPLVLALALLFMLLLIGSSNLITAFLAVVGFSLNLYVLVLFDAADSVAREAGAKYFYLSTFSSGLMIYGIFVLFVLAGTANYREMGQIFLANSEVTTYHVNLLQAGVMLLLTGLFFKLSAFPGHL